MDLGRFLSTSLKASNLSIPSCNPRPGVFLLVILLIRFEDLRFFWGGSLLGNFEKRMGFGWFRVFLVSFCI